MDHVVDEFQNKKKLAKHCSRSLGSPALHTVPKAPSGVRGGGWGGALSRAGLHAVSQPGDTGGGGGGREKVCGKRMTERQGR